MGRLVSAQGSHRTAQPLIVSLNAVSLIMSDSLSLTVKYLAQCIHWLDTEPNWNRKANATVYIVDGRFGLAQVRPPSRSHHIM